jgi:4-diphosphocytidyl-2-C-methyl-D-erythritol kinase
MSDLPHEKAGMTALAHAKLNLLLKITGRRDDGYHLLYTLFHRISLHDRITAVPVEGKDIRLVVPDALPDGPDNLVYRAARDFLTASGLEHGLEIHVDKKIPAGGGLGGGSSDAATTLQLLNRMFSFPLSRSRLHAIASGIGADVPFFLTGYSSAIGIGIGTELSPVEFPAYSFLLLFPDFGVNTAWAYSHCSISGELYGNVEGNAVNEAFLWQNDLERPVFEKYPVLRDVKERLVEAGALAAMMSGSGSTMFGVFSATGEAERCAASFPLPENWSLMLAESL